jgi:hypothetical protein
MVMVITRMKRRDTSITNILNNFGNLTIGYDCGGC